MEGNKLLNGMIYTGAFTLLRKAQTVYKITYFCYTCWFLQTGNGGSKIIKAKSLSIIFFFSGVPQVSKLCL